MKAQRIEATEAHTFLRALLRVTAAVSDAGPGWAELTVRAALLHGVHADAVARVSTMPA